MRLINRLAEKRALSELLDHVRVGMSGALVLRGEPGVGKSALLAYAVGHSGDLQVLRTTAVESERALGFAGLHQLLSPLLPVARQLPDPQQRALGVAFGLVSGSPADPFLVGLAVLTLLSDAAEEKPVLCVIDDAQWLDDESAEILSFVARRLLADRVGMLFALQETTQPEPRLQALPSLPVLGLPERDARELLAAAIASPLDSGVVGRLVAETAGNPLALVEVARELTARQLDARAPLPEPLPVGHRLELLFVRRVRELQTQTQTLLLLAATDPPGPGERLWRAAAALGIPESAAVPAEAAGLGVFWPEVAFAHPLVRAAVYQAATAVERRQAHRALAAASDPDREADARAWHLAAAAAGPDDEVAAELQAAAERARSRGGHAAAASLLERASMLTRGTELQAERRLAAARAHCVAGAVRRADALLTEAAPGLRDPRSVALAMELEGRIGLARGQVADATSALVGAARRMRSLDPLAARDALLSAVDASVFAGWAPSAALLQEIARIARDLPPTDESPSSAADLLLQGYTARVLDGYAAAVPALRRAVQAFLADEVDPDVALHRLELVAITAADLLDDASVERLTTRWIDLARESGALAKLATGLAFRSAFVDGPGGRLAEARAAEGEAHELGGATGNPAIVPPTGAHTVLTLALGGREAEARATAAAVAREAPGRSAAGEAAMAASFLGVLEISLGNYGAAVASLKPAYTDDTPLVGTQALPDLVEAAVRDGRRDLAEQALQRLAERAIASGTPLAMGLLARSRALLADPGEAPTMYEEAIDWLGRARTPPQLARTHLLYGEWLRRQRRRREARDQLRAAYDMFDGMGLHSFAERASVELRATGEHPQKRDVATPEVLTPQEARIAALVSRGDTNRDIAGLLFISPSTVDYHLRKAFRKLGVTSRTQLARRLIDESIGARVPQTATESSLGPGRR